MGAFYRAHLCCGANSMRDLLFLHLFVSVFASDVQLSQKPPSHPNIIFILADDMGWNDVSFHGSDQIPTYNIDSLGYFGVILNRHYSQPVCTPSRSSLMTGKYPLHTGVHSPLAAVHRTGLNLSEKIMPQYFKELGYSTHIVGKWHLGFHHKSFTPLQRGFDSHFGYYAGCISYYDHIYEEPASPVPPYNYTFSGHDLRRGEASAWDVVGQYATDLFTQQAVDIINNHPSEKPLFLYMPHLAPHAGNQGKALEAPQDLINNFQYITDPNRRTYAAMVSKLDQSVGEVISALERKNILKNSIVVFVSDNGARNEGLFNNYGSNFPFRGHKETLWEGGVRVPAVVWSPLIRNPSRVSYDLMHISDWLPTLLSAAGYEKQLTNIDGVDQWLAISTGSSSARQNLVVDIDITRKMTSLILDDFKYIKGPLHPNDVAVSNTFLNVHAIKSARQPGYNMQELKASPAWKALHTYSADSGLPRVSQLREAATVSCNHDYTQNFTCTTEACLFNIKTDPCEQHDVAGLYPSLLKEIEDLVVLYKKSIVPDVLMTSDPAANPELFNNTWTSWIK